MRRLDFGLGEASTPRTLSTSPDLPCVALFHESMASSTSSGWCTTYTGASAMVLRSASVTTIATSRMRSRSGTSPDISMSIQTSGVLSCGHAPDCVTDRHTCPRH